MNADERRSKHDLRELPGYASSGAFRAADEDDTAPGVPLGSLPPLASDVHEALGQLMAGTARNGRHIATLKRDYGVLRTEIVGMRKDLEQDRGVLVDASSKAAAKRTSNRTAALMGTLFTVYELLSPYLHELWRLAHT